MQTPCPICNFAQGSYSSSGDSDPMLINITITCPRCGNYVYQQHRMDAEPGAHIIQSAGDNLYLFIG